jgi:hypothetical protein
MGYINYEIHFHVHHLDNYVIVPLHTPAQNLQIRRTYKDKHTFQ